MKTFLIGLGVGIGLGILFAPDSGENTRRELGDRLNNFTDEAKRQAGSVAQQAGGEVRTKEEQKKGKGTGGRGDVGGRWGSSGRRLGALGPPVARPRRSRNR